MFFFCTLGRSSALTPCSPTLLRGERVRHVRLTKGAGGSCPWVTAWTLQQPLQMSGGLPVKWLLRLFSWFSVTFWREMQTWRGRDGGKRECLPPAPCLPQPSPPQRPAGGLPALLKAFRRAVEGEAPGVQWGEARGKCLVVVSTQNPQEGKGCGSGGREYSRAASMRKIETLRMDLPVAQLRNFSKPTLPHLSVGSSIPHPAFYIYNLT